MVFDAHDRGFALFKDVCTRGIYDRTSLAKDVGDFVFDGTPLKCAETDCGLIFIHGQFFRDAGVEEPRLHQRSSRPSRRKHFRMCLPMGRGQLPLGGAVPPPLSAFKRIDACPGFRSGQSVHFPQSLLCLRP
jgi:hypothetical protein